MKKNKRRRNDAVFAKDDRRPKRCKNGHRRNGGIPNAPTPKEQETQGEKETKGTEEKPLEIPPRKKQMRKPSAAPSRKLYERIYRPLNGRACPKNGGKRTRDACPPTKKPPGRNTPRTTCHRKRKSSNADAHRYCDKKKKISGRRNCNQERWAMGQRETDSNKDGNRCGTIPQKSNRNDRKRLPTPYRRRSEDANAEGSMARDGSSKQKTTSRTTHPEETKTTQVRSRTHPEKTKSEN